MFKGNIGKSLRHYLRAPRSYGVALQDHNLLFVLKKHVFLNELVDCCTKMFIENKIKCVTYKLSTSTRTCAKKFRL